MDASGKDRLGKLLYGDAWTVRIDNGILDHKVNEIIAMVRFEDKREVAKRNGEPY